MEPIALALAQEKTVTEQIKTLFATARETTPGPQATSNQHESGSAGTSSTRAPSVSAEVIAGELPNEPDWRVNSSRIESSYIAPA